MHFKDLRVTDSRRGFLRSVTFRSESRSRPETRKPFERLRLCHRGHDKGRLTRLNNSDRQHVHERTGGRRARSTSIRTAFRQL